MKLRVHLLQERNGELLENLGKNLDSDVTLSCGKEVPDPADYDILVCGVPDRESIEASPRLKYLIIPWSGLPRKTRELMRDYPGISIHNIHHNAVPVAEMAIALMLAAAKDLVPIDASFRRNDWGKRYDTHTMDLLRGKRVLVLGYGAIGKEIARRCLAFGMSVTGVRRTAPEEGGSETAGGVDVYPVSRLAGLLPAADVLFLSLPLTDETGGMVGGRELSLLPEGAILVNVSRGRIVDEEALFERLKASRLRAGLDVWYNYPESQESRASTPPSAYPFGDLPNVVMTPHLAGHSDMTETLRAHELSRLLNEASREGRLSGRVDPDLGY